ncbi:MAG: hypothetical protein AABY22_03335 [Nanoarchaeota archaeon]
MYFNKDYTPQEGDYFFETEEVPSMWSWSKTFKRAGVLHMYDGEKWITEQPDGTGCYSSDCGTPPIRMIRNIKSFLEEKVNIEGLKEIK